MDKQQPIKTSKYKLMLSCKEVTFLIEKSHDEKLKFWDAMRLKMHQSMCKACSAYEKQSMLINSLITHKFKKEYSDSSTQMNVTDFENKVIDKLK